MFKIGLTENFIPEQSRMPKTTDSVDCAGMTWEQRQEKVLSDLEKYAKENVPEKEELRQNVPKSDISSPEVRAADLRDLLDKMADEISESTDASSKCQDAQLSAEKISEKQLEAINEAFERIERGEELSDKEKGNLCEMMMDQYYIRQEYEPLHSPRITSLDAPISQGIDGVYEKDGKYVIVDAKYDQAVLHQTMDGKQLSDAWIDKRLDEAVGKEKADEIRDAYIDDPTNVSREVYHYDPHADVNGETHSEIYHVDSEGAHCRDTQVVEVYKDGSLQTDITQGWRE